MIKISAAFNKKDAFANKVNNVLKLVGNFVDVSRISIFINKESRYEASLVYEWSKNGIQPKINQEVIKILD
mgnify:CR=1 FL=1